MEEDAPLVDASTLIYLAKADAFREAQAAVGTLLVPPAVWYEAVEAGIQKGLADPEVIVNALAHGRLRKTDVTPSAQRLAHALAERHRLGEGESQVLAMAHRATRVVIDDLRATRVAIALGYRPVPTVFLPVVGLRERKLSHAAAMSLLRRLASVVELPVHQLARLEAMLGEPR